MPAFLATRNTLIPSLLRDLLPPITYQQFLLPLLAVTVALYLIAAAGLRKGHTWGVYLLLGFQVVMLINVLAHVAMASFLGGYAPGVATALIVNLPFSIYLLRQAVRERWVSRRAMLLMVPIGIIVHALGLPGLIILFGYVR
jgi:hypothetical protein